METWFIYAIIGSIQIGFFGILQKIEAENEIINRDGFIIYAYLGQAVLGLLGLCIFGAERYFDPQLLLLGIITGTTYVYVLQLRHKCLQYMSSSTYFINYRIFVSIFLIFFGIVFFKENIEFKEYLGIFMGIIVFVLLLEKKEETESDDNFKKGIGFLFFSILLASSLWAVNKVIGTSNYNLALYATYSGFTGPIAIMLINRKFNLKKYMYIPNKKIGLFYGTTALLFGGGFL